MTDRFFKVRTPEGNWRWVHLDGGPSCEGCEGTLREWVAEACVEQLDFEPQPNFVFREQRRSAPVGVRTVRLIRRERVYGGPEEGGWYWTYEDTVREWELPAASFERHRARLERYCEKQNEGLPSWDYANRLVVATWPKPSNRRPHYC